MAEHLQIPLPLAELLHSVLGPLAGRLKAEGHPWTELVQRILEAYCDQRDAFLVEKYGTVHILSEAHATTVQAAEAVCRFIEEITVEAVDFEQWSKEIDNGQ